MEGDVLVRFRWTDPIGVVHSFEMTGEAETSAVAWGHYSVYMASYEVSNISHPYPVQVSLVVVCWLSWAVVRDLSCR